MSELGFCDTLARRARVENCRSAEWSCRVAPEGGETGLQVYADWINLSFMLDDAALDRERSTLQPGAMVATLVRLAHVWDHPESEFGDDPFLHGYRDLSLRIRDGFPPRAARAVMDATLEWWFASVAFIGGRSDETTLGFGELVAISTRDVGYRTALALTEMAESTLLPDAERESPRGRVATQAALLLVRIVNDLFLYGRQQWEQTLEGNLVQAFARASRCSPQDAAVQAVRLHDRVMCLFLTLTESLEPTASESLQRFLVQLRHLVRGNIDYSLTVPRYRSESIGASHELPVRAPLTDTPSDGSLTAPPTPDRLVEGRDQLLIARPSARLTNQP